MTERSEDEIAAFQALMRACVQVDGLKPEEVVRLRARIALGDLEQPATMAMFAAVRAIDDFNLLNPSRRSVGGKGEKRAARS